MHNYSMRLLKTFLKTLLILPKSNNQKESFHKLYVDFPTDDDIKNNFLGTKNFISKNPEKWYYKTLIPIPSFIHKISFLKKLENPHHYLTFLKGLSL